VRFECECCDEDSGCAMRVMVYGLGSGGVPSRGQRQGVRFAQRRFDASFFHSVLEVGSMLENEVEGCWLG
jgi:hypothetical protein